MIGLFYSYSAFSLQLSQHILKKEAGKWRRKEKEEGIPFPLAHIQGSAKERDLG